MVDEVNTYYSTYLLAVYYLPKFGPKKPALTPLVTKVTRVTCSPGEKCLKYLWNFHLTAKEAKMVLLTKADLRSVRAPGEC